MRKNSTARISILATGNELIEGDTLNTNSYEIARILNAEHLPIGLHITVSDDETEMESALKFLLKHHRVVIITGGLGPTSDDRTRFVLSKVIKQDLIFDEACWQNIRSRIQQVLGREAHPSNRQQALFPVGAEIISNPHGSAAGCFVPYKNKFIFMLPGPPRECLFMFNTVVLPRLLALKKLKHNKLKLSWNVKGVSESEIASLIDEAVKIYPVITGYRANSPFVEIKIYTFRHDKFNEMLELVEKIIAPYIASK